MVVEESIEITKVIIMNKYGNRVKCIINNVYFLISVVKQTVVNYYSSGDKWL